MKPGKAAGPDNIPTWILNVCAVQIAPILLIIFTQTYNSGTLPSDWLTAIIIPIYKKGDKSLPVNYRSISLTFVCFKIMEHLVIHSILNHLNRYGIINPNQHGFRPGLSCQTQLVLLVDEILKLWTPTTKLISCYLISPKPSTQLLITNFYLNWHIMAYNPIHING